MSERVHAPELAGVWSAHKGHAAWLVLEQAQDTLRRLYELEDNPEVDWLFRDTRYAALEDRSPLVVRTRPDTALWQAFAEARGQPPLAGILVRSAATHEALVAHLRHRLEVALDGNRRALLRFHDPWVASALFSEDPVPAQWLGPIDGVFWYATTITRGAEQGPAWQGLLRDPADAGDPAGPDDDLARLTPAQHAALQTLVEQ